MRRNILRLLLTFFVILTINFFIPRSIPGDPFSQLADTTGQEATGLSEADIDRMKEYYGLDLPLHHQYVNTLKDNLQGNFGHSILYKRPVIDIIKEKLPWTMYLVFSSGIISLILGLSLALLSITRQKIDDAVHGVMTVIAEIPSFAIGIGLLFLVAANVKWIPLAGSQTPFANFDTMGEHLWDIFKHGLMPVSTLVLLTMPNFYFISRVSLLNTQEKMFMKAGTSRGLDNRRLKLQYLLKNSLVPVITNFLMSMGWIVGGTIIVENIFMYPGMGQTMREAVLSRDVILLQGILITTTIIVLISSLISELYLFTQRKY